MMRNLHDLSKNEGKRKSAHLPEKIHCACNGACIISANISANCIGYHHSKGE